MRRVVSLVGLLVVGVAMTVSSCASSSGGVAATVTPAVVVSSPAAAASPSATELSSRAAGCPAQAAWPSASRSPAPDGQLFVAGSPTLATWCHYVLFTPDGGSLPPPLVEQISGQTLTDLVAALNALVPTKDEPPCPAPMQADALTFGGGGAQSSMVHIERDGGCDFVWSDTGVHAYSTTTLDQQLAAITANAADSASSAASNTPTLTSPSAGATAIGDPTAIAQCQAAEKTREAALLAAGNTDAPLTVAAGFNTTEGDAHRYADSIGRHPGDPSPRPADSSSSYTNTTPVVVCILDGAIAAPNPPGNPPYSREFALISRNGTLVQLVAGHTDSIALVNPSSATP
jgi:hypothetical protein